MKTYDLYQEIFDPTKRVQMKKVKVDENGICHNFMNPYEGDWITITKDNILTTFLGHCLAGNIEIISKDAIRIVDQESHDGEIVDLHGRKYLLTEIKTIGV